MKKLKKASINWMSNVNLLMAVFIGVVISMLFVTGKAHAADLLANTMGDVNDTMTGVGKKWVILIDFVISLGSFVMTKKPLVFFSVLAVTLAISAVGVLIK